MLKARFSKPENPMAGQPQPPGEAVDGAADGLSVMTLRYRGKVLRMLALSVRRHSTSSRKESDMPNGEQVITMIPVNINYAHVLSAEFRANVDKEEFIEILTDLAVDAEGRKSPEFIAMNKAVEEQRRQLPLHRRGGGVRYVTVERDTPE